MDVRFVLCVGHRIAEKQHKVDLIIRYARGDLLLAALHTRKALVDFQTGSFFNKLAGGAGGTDYAFKNTAYAMQNCTISSFAVMCDQCYIHQE